MIFDSWCGGKYGCPCDWSPRHYNGLKKRNFAQPATFLFFVCSRRDTLEPQNGHPVVLNGPADRLG